MKRLVSLALVTQSTVGASGRGLSGAESLTGWTDSKDGCRGGREGGEQLQIPAALLSANVHVQMALDGGGVGGGELG